MKQEPLKQKKNSGLTRVFKSPLIDQYRNAGNRAIQAKMTMGEPDDEYEQEADRVAAQVMRMSEPNSLEEEEEQVAPKLQREELEEEEEPEQEGGPSTSAKAPPGGTTEISPEVEKNIDALKGGGEPLSKSSRDFFEPRFGADFSQVRIHTDPRAAQTAEAINAKAFTTGKDIVFNSGQYTPESNDGKHLMAHELTHVVQQGESLKFQKLINPGKCIYTNDILFRQKGSKTRRDLIRIKKRADCWYYLGFVKDTLEKKRISWNIAARTIGSAYAEACEFHKTAVEMAAREKAINDAIMFGILTMVCVGAFGWLGEAAQLGMFGKRFKTIIAAGLEDAIQTGISEAIDVGQAVVVPTARTVEKNPLVFQNSLLNLLDDQWKNVLDFFIKTKNTLRNANLAKFDSVNPIILKTKLNRWLKRNKFMTEPKPMNQIEIRNELERSFWAKWIPKLYKGKKIVAKGIIRDVYASPGGVVEKRLKYLKIVDKNFGFIWTSDREIIKIITWAKGFKPKKFGF